MLKFTDVHFLESDCTLDINCISDLKKTSAVFVLFYFFERVGKDN